MRLGLAMEDLLCRLGEGCGNLGQVSRYHLGVIIVAKGAGHRVDGGHRCLFTISFRENISDRPRSQRSFRIFSGIDAGAGLAGVPELNPNSPRFEDEE